MSKAEKRLAGMKANPRKDWTIEDVEAVCEAFGVRCTPPTRGGHYKVSHDEVPEILTIPANRPIKPVYIKRLVKLIEQALGDSDP